MTIVRTQCSQSTDQDRHFGSSQGQQLRLVDQQVGSVALKPRGHLVAEASCARFENGKRLHIGLLLSSIGAARGEGNFHVVTGLLRRSLHGSRARENNEIGQRRWRAARSGNWKVAPTYKSSS